VVLLLSDERSNLEMGLALALALAAAVVMIVAIAAIVVTTSTIDVAKFFNIKVAHIYSSSGR
jgi:hypothetical protein